MREELDNQLCQKYPKIFRDRRAPMNQTCMCWGFSHGDGWFNIIDALCGNIQSHIDWSRKQRASALLYNRALARSTKDNVGPLIRYFQGSKAQPSDWDFKRAQEVFDDIEPQCRLVPAACAQVVAVQVKEKFGTLRFYYNGGDDIVRGMVRMAESMSAVMCEECGAPGRSRRGGWIQTLCDEHAKAAGKEEDMNWEEMP